MLKRLGTLGRPMTKAKMQPTPHGDAYLLCRKETASVLGQKLTGIDGIAIQTIFDFATL